MTEEEKSRLRLLAAKYLKNTISESEREELETWFREQRDEPLDIQAGFAPDEEALERRIFDAIQAKIRPGREARRVALWPRIAAAASIIIAISAGGYFLLHQKPVRQLASNDVAPFSKQAILKTGHGKTLVLDSNARGTLAQYTNAHIQKTGGVSIAYTNSSETEKKIIFDTLQVPAGGKPYNLQLADGSNIMVNVASALRFPENFRKNNNEMELISGEAYFSIIHNASSPLTIKAQGQLIEDIGTEFNVNTYADEPDSRTTLVVGAIKVNAKAILPGQQAIISAGNLIVAKANVQQATAWKDGYFRFNGEHIQAVMRELARWYNIQVAYEGKVTDAGFYLRITRSRNISDVLKVLERTNSVHFKIEGRRVTVLGKT